MVKFVIDIVQQDQTVCEEPESHTHWKKHIYIQMRSRTTSGKRLNAAFGILVVHIKRQSAGVTEASELSYRSKVCGLKHSGAGTKK